MGRTPWLIWYMPTQRVKFLLVLALSWQTHTSHHILPSYPRYHCTLPLSLKDDQIFYAILARLTQQVVCLCREVVTLGSRGLCQAATSRSSPVDSAGAVQVGADIFEAAGLHQGEDTCQDG